MVKKLGLALWIMNLFPLSNNVRFKIFRFLLLFILPFFLFSNLIFSYEIKTELNRDKCKIGDVLRLKINITYKNGETVDIYKRKGNFFQIYLRKIKIKKGKNNYSVIYKFQPFFLGKKELPSFPIKINGVNINYQPPTIFVKSITDDKSKPKPLKPPYEVVIKRSYGMPIALSGIVIFILIFAVYFLKIRKKEKAILEEKITYEELPEIQNFSNFLSKIEGLRKSKLYEKDGRYFAFLLNKFIRDILTLYFSENFLIFTNGEVIEFLESEDVSVKSDLKWLLNSCELVEFSPEYFNSDLYEKMLNVALKIGRYFTGKNG